MLNFFPRMNFSNSLVALKDNGCENFEAFLVKEFDIVPRLSVSPQQAAPVSFRVSLKQTVKTLRIMFAGQGVGAYQIIGHHPVRCPPKELRTAATIVLTVHVTGRDAVLEAMGSFRAVAPLLLDTPLAPES